MTTAQSHLPFVGREPELAFLRRSLAAAEEGRGGLMLVSGEPGIGKTRLVDTFAVQARAMGAQVLWSRCADDVSAPAYWPWSQLLRGLLAPLSMAELRMAVGPGAAHVLPLVPELGDRLPDVLSAVFPEPEQARFQLFESLSRVFTPATWAKALVLVLDDLHGADTSSLLFLQFLARELSGSRVLLIATYRHTELSEQHPLSATIAAVVRERGTERLLLSGLNLADVERVIAGLTSHVSPSRVAPAMLQRTDGNPFFIGQVVHLVTDAGPLNDETQEILRQPPVVPPTVRDVIGQRLRRIKPACRQLLDIAAVVGREFGLAVLAEISGVPPLEVLDILEEAETAHLLTSPTLADAEFRFVHALVQETLQAELPASRRLRIHAHLATALERLYGEQATRHASELAHHFAQAAALTTVHMRRAAMYSRVAAEQAEGVTAWEDAAQHYEQCLTLIARAADTLDQDEPTLRLALSRVRRYSGQYRAGWVSAMQAIDLYSERGDGLALARATLNALAFNGSPRRAAALAEAALAALGDSEPYTEACLLTGLAHVLDHQQEQARRAAERAAALAREHGYGDVTAHLNRIHARRAISEMRLEDAAALLRSAYAALASLGRRAEALEALYPLATLPLFQGPLAEAEARAGEALAYARTVRSNYHELNILCALAGVALARGNDDGFDSHIAEAAGDNYWRGLLGALRAEIAGDFTQAMALLPTLGQSGGYPTYQAHVLGARARVLFNVGEYASARREFAAWRDACAAITGGYAVTHNKLLAFTEVAECLPSLADNALVREVYDQLLAMRPIRFAPWSARGVDAVRGTLALHLQEVDAAMQHFELGLSWSEREELVVEQGRCLEGLAEVAWQRRQPEKALVLLEHAAALFDQRGAHFYTRRVRAKQELARNAPETASSPTRPHLASRNALSTRETEVLRMVMRGQTNQEIARALVLSPGTVARHTANIYAKIGARSRAEAVAYALRHGLAGDSGA